MDSIQEKTYGSKSSVYGTSANDIEALKKRTYKKILLYKISYLFWRISSIDKDIMKYLVKASNLGAKYFTTEIEK